MTSENFTPITRLTRDLANSARDLTKQEARLLVSFYYDWQEQRIRAAGQTRAAAESGEPHEIFTWMTKEAEVLEGQIKRALTKFMENDPVGEWASSICGIGPVITAGLLAHVDITKANVATKLWAYAGLAPDQKRKRGEKSDWNPALKRLSWLMWNSFVKVKGNENDVYGKLYEQRKAYEAAINEQGGYKDQAEKALKEKKFDKSTEAYKWYMQGKLPPGHLHSRAGRFAAKMALSHLHTVMYFVHYGELPAQPFAIAHLGHVDYIAPPNAELIPGLAEALQAAKR